jgi:chromosome segregation ATPase
MLDIKVAKARNEVTATVQEMEKQLNSSDFNKQVLEQQNTLLSTRQSLNDSLTSLVRSEFEIAERLEKSDRKRQQIKEAAAKYEIQALEYQQQLKQQGLEIEIRQMQIAQERAEIENEIARIRATAQIAEAQANIAKTKADPNATNEQIVAAELELQARLMEFDALDRQRGLILGQRDIVGEQIKAKVIENEISNIIAKRQSQMRLIDAYDNPIIKQALSEQLKNSGALKLPQVNFNNKATTMADNIRSQFDNNSANISKQLNVDIPPQKLVTTPSDKARLDGSILSSIGTQVSKIAAEIKNIGKSGIGDITINNTATAGDTQDLMAQMKNQTLKTLDGVLEKTMKMQYG